MNLHLFILSIYYPKSNPYNFTVQLLYTIHFADRTKHSVPSYIHILTNDVMWAIIFIYTLKFDL